MSSHKPDGYTSVAPYLVVDGASKTIEFLVRALDAVELRRFDGEDGRVMHGEVRIDDTVVMIADPPEGQPPIPSLVHIYVPDVDSAYKRMLEAGGESAQEPVQRDDPDKRGGVKDPGGTTWWVATQVG
ncbi:MAG: VOC family protein [Deltaproteobacteria bacterium]|nr:VOC family protein [Deltaproteobacteria bacterium]MBW2416546.1 VOC family protein [Deltaproteobacteria bacterium]